MSQEYTQTYIYML